MMRLLGSACLIAALLLEIAPQPGAADARTDAPLLVAATIAPAPAAPPTQLLTPAPFAAPATPPPIAPNAQPSPTPPPGATAPAPATPPQPLRFTGQLLDVRAGYVFFTTGDAFKLVTVPRYVSFETGQPTTLQPRAGLYARAILDPVTRLVIELDLTPHFLALDKQYESVKSYASVKSTPEAAPEIRGVAISGKPVPVSFIVTVPPNTPLNANVYITTDVSGWDPKAILMDRINGQQYRVTRTFASGTKFAFRVTRGSWQTEEVGENGLEPDVHKFEVHEIDSQLARATVYAWLDQNASQSQPAPGAIPTPYNPNPFPPYGQTPGGRKSRTQPSPPPGYNPNIPQ